MPSSVFRSFKCISGYFGVYTDRFNCPCRHCNLLATLSLYRVTYTKRSAESSNDTKWAIIRILLTPAVCMCDFVHVVTFHVVTADFVTTWNRMRRHGMNS